MTIYNLFEMLRISSTFVLLIALSVLGRAYAGMNDGQIWDPFDVFCGSRDCYSVLGVERSSNSTTISKAYRKLSRAVHPDKVRDPAAKANATAAFRLIAKANEVLQGNESRPNYDYYLNNGPRSYYKVTGKHVWKALPKAPAWFVVLAALALASWFFHVVQNQKHERAKKMLRIQISQGWTKAEGGSQLSINLSNKAKREFESSLRESKEPAAKIKLKLLLSSTQGRLKIAEDQEFLEIVDKHIANIADWGEHYKPKREHLLIVRMFQTPWQVYAWGVKYHRRYISKEPLSYQEREEMCLEMVGCSIWDELTDAEKKEAVEREVWKSEEYDQWQEDRAKKFVGSKKYKKLVKKYGDMADFED